MQRILVAFIALLTTACIAPVPDGPAPAPSAGSTGTINLATAFALDTAVSIDIAGFDPNSTSGYVSLREISDTAFIAEAAASLEQDLSLLPPPACVDQYRITFVLADGTMAEFGFSCDEDTNLLRGNLPGSGAVAAPETFAEMIRTAIQPGQ